MSIDPRNTALCGRTGSVPSWAAAAAKYPRARKEAES